MLRGETPGRKRGGGGERAPPVRKCALTSRFKGDPTERGVLVRLFLLCARNRRQSSSSARAFYPGRRFTVIRGKNESTRGEKKKEPDCDFSLPCRSWWSGTCVVVVVAVFTVRVEHTIRWLVGRILYACRIQAQLTIHRCR